MKSFFALALLGALVSAGAQEDDLAAKAAVADVKNSGTDTAPLTQTIVRPDVTLTTDGKTRGVLKQATGVRKTTGTDSQTYFQYMFQIEPSADYQANTSKLDIAFAANKFEQKVDYTQWSNRIASIVVFDFNYATLSRSINEIEATANTLNS